MSCAVTLGEIPPVLAALGIVGGLAAGVTRDGGGPAGLIAAYVTAPREFEPEERGFVDAVASVLAGALDRAHAARALSESEARARAVLETTVEAVVTIDARGLVQSFNPAAERIFGYAAAEVVGQLWLAQRALAGQAAPHGAPRPITNVVFMGMGEPLLNYDATVTAARIMLDDDAYGLSRRRVTSPGVHPRSPSGRKGGTEAAAADEERHRCGQPTS